MSTKTALYRHFDADGALLYVGISNSAFKRLDQHKAASHWAMDIARVEMKWFETREEAISAEREAIRNESPRHNIRHHQPAKFTPSGAPRTLMAALEALGLEYATGVLPREFAADIQSLMDEAQRQAMSIIDRGPS